MGLLVRLDPHECLVIAGQRFITNPSLILPTLMVLLSNKLAPFVKYRIEFIEEGVNIKKFHEEIIDCQQPKSIILGNGFGLSFDSATGGKSFDWQTLLKCAEIREDSPVYKLLQECNFDFEIAHQKINNALEVIKQYDPENTISEMLNFEIENLKRSLISAVKKSHPEHKPVNKSIENCQKFLGSFKTIFSLNYDLLLYWVRCHKSKEFLGEDSFGKSDENKLIFSPSDTANYFFPHGALFLYRHRYGAEKLKSSSSTLLKQIETKINEGHFPMCISEGTGSQKLEAIKRNEYLRYSYEQILKCEGTIFTFGCSFQDTKDDHIIDALFRSHAGKIVIGAFQPDTVENSRLTYIFGGAKKKLRSKTEFSIVDTVGTQIW